jgi:K+-sensing histidine kinase KdpD
MRFRSIANAPWFVRYSFALLLVALALALTIVVSPFREHGHFLMFFAAVIVSQIYGGTGAGILATVLSIATVDFFLVPPI